MTTFLKNANNYSSQVTSDISSAVQDIDQILWTFEQDYPNDVSQDFFLTLLDNVCQPQYFSQNMTWVCQNIS
jgi:hypothetical protein